jgi:O-methyltransferase
MTVPPSTDPEQMRRAYLDLLKLSLCDLVGSGTGSVEGLPAGRLAARELRGEERLLREQGRDWPEHGLTMTGLDRLNDLQSCVESISADQVPGDLIEAGSWRGGSSMLMRATLDTLGELDRTVWVADSFRGFPHVEPEGRSGYTQTLEPYLVAFELLSVPEEEVRASFRRLGLERGVRLLPGFFEETLPPLVNERFALARLDGDTYEATLLALRCLYPALEPGGYLIVDDFMAFEECRAAVERFRAEHRIEEPLHTVDWTCVRWRKERQVELGGADLTAKVRTVSPASGARPPRERIPSHRELELADRVRELEQALASIPEAGTGSIARTLRRAARQMRARQRSSRR